MITMMTKSYDNNEVDSDDDDDDGDKRLHS